MYTHVVLCSVPGTAMTTSLQVINMQICSKTKAKGTNGNLLRFNDDTLTIAWSVSTKT